MQESDEVGADLGSNPLKQNDCEEEAPGYAPNDPLDGRLVGDWRTDYSPAAKKEIRAEAIYLCLLLYGAPLLMLLLWLDLPQSLLSIPLPKYAAVCKYCWAWCSGVLGGTLFALKWLYHSVAKKIWHSDRRLWRVFTPHVSGGLSFVTIALISSGLIRIFDRDAIETPSLIVGAGFLVGYFSDSAIAKLTEIAETLFGASHNRGKDSYSHRQIENDSNQLPM